MTSNRALLTLTPATQRVIDAIIAVGGRPLIVGGTVRDALLAVRDGATVSTPKDADVEVYGLADKAGLIAALRIVGRVDERESFTGAGHRAFDAAVDAELDVTTAFGRRDFTINAIGWDPATGSLVDPYDGRADIAAGVLRHTTDAFADDPLRVLRAVQFAGRFGFTLAPETAALARSIAGEFHTIARERVWAELAKLLTRGRSISHALAVLEQTGWEEHFPELAATRGVRQDPLWHPEGDVHRHLSLAADAAVLIADRDQLDDPERLTLVTSALLHDLGKVTHTREEEAGERITSHQHADAGVEPAQALLRRVGAPAWLIEHVGILISEHMSHLGGPSRPAVRRLLRRLARPSGTGPSLATWTRVVEADLTGRESGRKPAPGHLWLAVAETLQVAASPSSALLRGHHLLEAGVRPGVGMAPVIAASVVAQDEGEFDDVDGAVLWLRAFIDSGRYEGVYRAELARRSV
ncbi:HD domain-containing protein [Rathayibacter iranicus]|uniref:HD domain-containing protein n=2 Tax=Rathayibacter iranicus TaxID=59737 RepID=A0AAD2PTU3_9MICO|nr:HD domain-containing protein [Rathayibacter iranicus]AZZ55007.1 HD domain-containing protein [Rathayibacter iranicus]MWV32269.1 HD domain-containing protein [Rathayibacter iranicus NCPPB 2253 = VKM Ac-1602]PPI62391.1 metal-dependent phosphohydrolase [Rathayibacter iranicus]PWJ60821.1 tRNA nucleotidyltransferase (CCA-adding enzyme) [Rathayibacter iranicus NCPPB 2253 = VKM Ac-1602]